jgi:hypothetical protein
MVIFAMLMKTQAELCELMLLLSIANACVMLVDNPLMHA